MRISILALALAIFSPPVFAKINIVTTTTDLQFLVDSVGKDRVESAAIAKGTQDPHQIEAKPSFMVKMRGADLLIAHGLELESAWLDPLLQGARNPKLAKGGKGYFEIGEALEPIEAVNGAVSRAEGDVHPEGNPHFQLDPIRMGKAAVLIAGRLAELDGANREFYIGNANHLKQELEEKTKIWQQRLQKSGVKEVVSYHKTFSYFFHRFGIKNSLQLEPKPGIPPTASHLMEVITEMKNRNIRLVLIENYFDDSASEKLKTEVSGLSVARVPVSIGGEPEVKSIFDLMERLVKTFEGAKN